MKFTSTSSRQQFPENFDDTHPSRDENIVKSVPSYREIVHNLQKKRTTKHPHPSQAKPITDKHI